MRNQQHRNQNIDRIQYSVPFHFTQTCWVLWSSGFASCLSCFRLGVWSSCVRFVDLVLPRVFGVLGLFLGGPVVWGHTGNAFVGGHSGLVYAARLYHHAGSFYFSIHGRPGAARPHALPKIPLVPVGSPAATARMLAAATGRAWAGVASQKVEMLGPPPCPSRVSWPLTFLVSVGLYTDRVSRPHGPVG